MTENPDSGAHRGGVINRRYRVATGRFQDAVWIQRCCKADLGSCRSRQLGTSAFAVLGSRPVERIRGIEPGRSRHMACLAPAVLGSSREAELPFCRSRRQEKWLSRGLTLAERGQSVALMHLKLRKVPKGFQGDLMHGALPTPTRRYRDLMHGSACEANQGRLRQGI